MNSADDIGALKAGYVAKNTACGPVGSFGAHRALSGSIGVGT